MRRRSVIEFKIKELEDSAKSARSKGQHHSSEIRERQALALKNSLGKTTKAIKHDMLLTRDEISSMEKGNYSGSDIFKAKRVNQIRKWILGGYEE